jgi:hypothetical protein
MRLAILIITSIIALTASSLLYADVKIKNDNAHPITISVTGCNNGMCWGEEYLLQARNHRTDNITIKLANQAELTIESAYEFNDDGIAIAYLDESCEMPNGTKTITLNDNGTEKIFCHYE